MSADTMQVLLADDDPDDRILFAEALNATSFTTNLTTTNNGAQLMHYLYNHLGVQPDVLFLDLNMPLKNGFECFTEIKNDDGAFNNLNIVIFSTTAAQQVVDIFYENGAFYFIQKPFDFKNLIKLIQHVLERISKKNVERPLRKEFLLR